MIYNDLAHGGGTNQTGKTNAMTTPILTSGAIEKSHVISIIMCICRIYLNMYLFM